MKKTTNPVDAPENQHESTYGLLMRSEEKSRNALEMVIYPLLIIGAIVAIWQFVLQPMKSPAPIRKEVRYSRRIGHICGVTIAIPKSTLERAILSPLAEI